MAPNPVDKARAFLESLGLDAERDAELERTPERVTALLQDLFSGLDEPAPELSTFDFEGEDADAVLVCALPFKSMCVHHLLPFFGTVDIAYLPSKKMAGFGGFCRVVDWAASRPQVQERLVEEIASHLQDLLAPEGLLVRCRARQMCVEMRGARKRGVYISTSSRGTLRSGEARSDVMRQFVAAEESI